MPFTGKVGDSIHIDDLGGGHQYVIITKPNSNNEVVIVNFTAEKPHKDCSTTFRRRDDPKLFIKPTVVNYPQATPFPLSALKKEAAKVNCNYKFCSENIVRRIIIGAFQSQFTPPRIQRELKAQYPEIASRYLIENNP